MDPLEHEQDAASVLLLEIAGMRYALAVEVVQEVLPMVAPAALPDWREPMLGLIELRGSLIPLIDAAPLLHARPAPLGPSQFVVVVVVAGRRFGLVVDRVEDVRVPELMDAETSQAELIRAHGAVCAGVVSAGGPVVLLDAAALVNAARARSGEAEVAP